MNRVEAVSEGFQRPHLFGMPVRDHKEGIVAASARVVVSFTEAVTQGPLRVDMRVSLAVWYSPTISPNRNPR